MGAARSVVSIGLGNISPGMWLLQPAREPEPGGTHKAFCKGDPSHHVHSFPSHLVDAQPHPGSGGVSDHLPDESLGEERWKFRADRVGWRPDPAHGDLVWDELGTSQLQTGGWRCRWVLWKRWESGLEMMGRGTAFFGVIEEPGSPCMGQNVFALLP